MIGALVMCSLRPFTQTEGGVAFKSRNVLWVKVSKIEVGVESTSLNATRGRDSTGVNTAYIIKVCKAAATRWLVI